MKVIKNLRYKIQQFILLLTLSVLSAGCVNYSLSGGDTGSAKTLNVRFFVNEGAAPPNLSPNFTEKLRDYYQQNTKLALVTSGGDWVLEGSIIGYTVAPTSPSGTGTSALNRLDIKVNVNFTNNVEGPNEIKSFEGIFSAYSDFPQSQNLSQVQAQLHETILDQIVFEIFSRTTSNW